MNFDWLTVWVVMQALSTIVLSWQLGRTYRHVSELRRELSQVNHWIWLQSFKKQENGK